MNLPTVQCWRRQVLLYYRQIAFIYRLLLGLTWATRWIVDCGRESETVEIRVLDEQISDGCCQEQCRHCDEIDHQERHRRESSTKATGDSPPAPSEKRINHEPANRQADEERFAPSLVLDVDDRHADQHGNQPQMPNTEPGRSRRRLIGRRCDGLCHFRPRERCLWQDRRWV